MKEKDLHFDRKTHRIYSKAVKKIILDRLHRQYPPELAQGLWEDTQRAYVRMLDKIPYMGGIKNSQSGSVYDCAALFAYYEVVPEKPSLEEFGKMNDELFLPQMERVRFANLNRPIFMKMATSIFRFLSQRSLRHRQDWPGNYHMELRPCPEGVKYVFLRCPIAELAKRLGYTHLMPAMCNPDYPLLDLLHGGLIRRTTCAHGTECDFWILGSESEYLRKYPKKQSPEGYLYNEPAEKP